MAYISLLTIDKYQACWSIVKTKQFLQRSCVMRVAQSNEHSPVTVKISRNCVFPWNFAESWRDVTPGTQKSGCNRSNGKPATMLLECLNKNLTH